MSIVDHQNEYLTHLRSSSPQSNKLSKLNSLIEEVNSRNQTEWPNSRFSQDENYLNPPSPTSSAVPVSTFGIQWNKVEPKKEEEKDFQLTVRHSHKSCIPPGSGLMQIWDHDFAVDFWSECRGNKDWIETAISLFEFMLRSREVICIMAFYKPSTK